MCLQFSVDNYLLQVLVWARTEYGDSLQSLVNPPSLRTNSFNVHSSVSDIVSEEVSITLHYITRRKISWCLFEIFFSLTWENVPWFFLNCPVQKKFPMIWQTSIFYFYFILFYFLISWTVPSGQPGYASLPGSSIPTSPTSPHNPTLSTPAPFDWTCAELSPTTPYPWHSAEIMLMHSTPSGVWPDICTASS